MCAGCGSILVAPCFQADSSGKLSVHDGQLLDLNCISKGGKPAAGIDWKMEGSVVKENVASRSELESNGFRFTSISTLKLKVRLHYTAPAGSHSVRELLIWLMC